MQHLRKGRKFGMVRKVRKAFIKSIASSLILKERIHTTVARAKEVRPFVEKLVTHAKKGGLAKRRLVRSALPADAAKKVFDELAPRFKDRAGGYTRIIRTGRRLSDSAETAIIEFVD
ncbi:MAG: 50S ribosomal protein L17 [Candidatus Sungbacteria bacterium]|nr:50S ribosomal protein L17 [Candidatus Sungbacteria bacterium]